MACDVFPETRWLKVCQGFNILLTQWSVDWRADNRSRRSSGTVWGLTVELDAHRSDYQNGKLVPLMLFFEVGLTSSTLSCRNLIKEALQHIPPLFWSGWCESVGLLRLTSKEQSQQCVWALSVLQMHLWLGAGVVYTRFNCRSNSTSFNVASKIPFLL